MLANRFQFYWIIIAGLLFMITCFWLDSLGVQLLSGDKYAECSTGWQRQDQSFQVDFSRLPDPSANQAVVLNHQSQDDLLAEMEQYIELLGQYEDEQLTSHFKLLKYKNLALASTLVSASVENRAEQQKWSGIAIEFSRIASESMDAMPSDAMAGNKELLEEINTRRLIAMALNYYQQGNVSQQDLLSLYLTIDKGFLVRSGFCRLKILRAMERDGIIQLPVFSTEKYI